MADAGVFVLAVGELLLVGAVGGHLGVVHCLVRAGFSAPAPFSEEEGSTFCGLERGFDGDVGLCLTLKRGLRAVMVGGAPEVHPRVRDAGFPGEVHGVDVVEGQI